MPNPITYHQLNIAKIYRENLLKDQTSAQIRDEYFEENHDFIEGKTREDLSSYVSNANTGYMRLPPLDKFVYSFLKKASNVYSREAVIRIMNDQGAPVDPDDEDLKKINLLLKEMNYWAFAHDSQMRAKLHNTILRQVRYNKTLDLMYLQNGYNVGTCLVKSLKDYSLEPLFVAYEYMKKDSKYQYVIWKRPDENGEGGEVYFSDNAKWDYETYDFTGKKIPVGNNKGTSFNAYWPWIVQRERNQNELFWGHGFDAVVELVRFCYILLMVTGDDAIQETLRILILNFDPTGNKTEGGKIKVGIRNPIWKENAVPGDKTEAKGQILEAKLYIKEILEFTYALSDILGALHDIPNVLKQKLEKALSGIHQRLINEPILRSWSEDIVKVRKPDIETIETAIKINNYERGVRNVGENAQKTEKMISEKVFGNILVDYSEPKILTDPKEDLEVEVGKWKTGISNPILYVRRLNPDIPSDDKAKEYIKKNLDITKELKLAEQSLGSFNRNKPATE